MRHVILSVLMLLLAVPVGGAPARADGPTAEQSGRCRALWDMIKNKSPQTEDEFMTSCLSGEMKVVICPAVPDTRGMSPEKRDRTCDRLWKRSEGNGIMQNCDRDSFMSRCTQDPSAPPAPSAP